MWEEQKAQGAPRRRGDDRGTPTTVAVEGAEGLPALRPRAAKLGKRAARVGFDWPQASGAREGTPRELAEVDEVLAAVPAADAANAADGADSADARVAEELGDLLFSLANWSRHLRVDPEEALRGANVKFERRFARMEQLAAERAQELKSLTPEAWDRLWREAKLNGS